MAAMRSSRSVALRSVPECQVPSSPAPEPSERGKISYQEPARGALAVHLEGVLGGG